ncbi:S-adenosyl-L-methionine-dependent methyltransferase [Westerdykella ornata]|uniref:S-adenosyl-L-methionine-dependent methyltransferase n=1 Tax=Westerdykella ornata TaxID=318751 RepID=A0A6A6JUU5_WESOR|nr:S-adenosyl-L-methionine-dependent methyltransferase [Westerdykella ornata]KAF2280352.1 S-adenosyl-L-methionine-dependent methyltransferase [Westerdykella ornata]
MSTGSITETNRLAFNTFASQYDILPWNQRLTSQIRTALEDRKDWIGARFVSESNSDPNRLVKLIDYACGTGAITKALGPYVNSVKGIDISEQMVERYNAAARNSGLAPEQASAVVGNLCLEQGVPEELLGEEWNNFDVAAISLGFHHFESPSLALRRLAERLRPGSGVLVIVDFLPTETDGHAEKCSHGHKHGNEAHSPHHGHGAHHAHGAHHKHHSEGPAHSHSQSGFTRESMKQMYTEAGVGADFDFVVLPEPAVLGEAPDARKRKLFIAKGRRADSKL